MVFLLPKKLFLKYKFSHFLELKTNFDYAESYFNIK